MTNSFPPNPPSPFQLPPNGNPSPDSNLSSQLGSAQTLFSPGNPQQFKKPKSSIPPKLLIGLIGLSVVLGGGYIFAGQTGLLPQTFNELPTQWLPFSNQLFVSSAGLTQPEAQALYQKSLEALKKQQNQDALDGFLKLEKAYPGLAELIWLHQAEAYAALGEEANAQKRLNSILTQFPKSPLAFKAHYLLAQSHVRASEIPLALNEFKALRQKAPQSDYGIGSLFYLGQLVEKQAPEQARLYWLGYLNECPKCRFSGDSAEALQRQLDADIWKQPTASEHGLIGIGLAASDRQWDKALAHLQQAPIHQSWFYLAKAYLKKSQPDKTAVSFLAGLPTSTDPDQSQEAIDWLIRSKLPNITEQLSILANNALPQKGDYLLWQLAQAKPAGAANYYQQILSRFPNGDYAPESSWNLLWASLTSGQYSAYITGAAQHIQKYPYARSTPKVLFWLGKSYEKTGNKTDATSVYQSLTSKYPNQYYSFRAQSRLNALNNQPDTAWITIVTPYQPTFSLNSIRILPDKAWFLKEYQTSQGNTVDANRVYRALEELQSIGAADDVLLLSESALTKTPPAMASWAYQINNERPRGLRVIRDALQDRLKLDVNHTATIDERRLLYPVYFAKYISENSPQFNVDPYIIQGLMREESYFNEFATSGSNARGLMQLLPTTAGDVVAWEKKPGFNVMSLFDPATNIHLGTHYLKFLHEQFADLPPHLRSMAAVGAYNGGPNAMRRWINANPNFTKDPDLFVEEIPYEQTRDYIKKVFGSAWNYRSLYGTSR